MQQRALTTSLKRGPIGSESTYGKVRINLFVVATGRSEIQLQGECGRVNGADWEAYAGSEFAHTFSGADFDDIMDEIDFDAMMNRAYVLLETAGKIPAGTEEAWA